MHLSREDIYPIILSAISREEPFILTPKGQLISFFCEVVEIKNYTLIIKNPIPAIHAPFVTTAESYSLFFRQYWMTFDHIKSHGKNILVEIPEQINVGQSRNEERIYFSNKENVNIVIPHPFDKGTFLKRKVIDLSSGGLSFRAKFRTLLIQPGRILNHFKIHKSENEIIEQSGKVVYLKQIVDLSGQNHFQVGVQFNDVGAKKI